MGRVKLYPVPGVGGIPAEGEWFETEDANRRVGQGLASRRPPAREPSRDRGSAKRKPAVKREG